MKLIQFEPLFIRHFSTVTWPFPLHNHNHYELMFIRNGKGTHELNQEITAYSGETIFLLAPEDSHNFMVEEETEFNVIKFLPAVLKGGINASMTDYWDHLLNNLVRKWKSVSTKSEDHSLKNIITVIDLMISEWKNHHKQVTEVHTNLLRSLLLLLDKSFREVNDHGITDYGASKIERLQNYIHAHIRSPEKLTSKNLSTTFGVSESGLRAMFVSGMQMSIRDYIIALKLEKIKEKMKNSDSTLSEIAQEFAFTDGSHFNHFLKKHTGMKPLAFKRKNR